MHCQATWLDAYRKALDVEVTFNSKSSYLNFVANAHPTQDMGPTQTLNFQKVSLAEIDKRKKQGLFYYYDEKYSPGHKCKEPKFIKIDATKNSSSKEAPSTRVPK